MHASKENISQLKFKDMMHLEETKAEEELKLELKPLLEELKYSYLRDQQTCLVVISSRLTSDQEGKSLTILKLNKTAIS